MYLIILSIDRRRKMSNILDYVKWRGDLSFQASPFNEVDNLIISMLSYIHFDGVVEPNFNKPKSYTRFFNRRII